MRTIESYKGCGIEAIVRVLEDHSFTAYGYIRKPNAIGTSIPFEDSFHIGQSHPTERDALRAGIGFAKSKIDLK